MRHEVRKRVCVCVCKVIPHGMQCVYALNVYYDKHTPFTNKVLRVYRGIVNICTCKYINDANIVIGRLFEFYKKMARLI